VAIAASTSSRAPRRAGRMAATTPATPAARAPSASWPAGIVRPLDQDHAVEPFGEVRVMRGHAEQVAGAHLLAGEDGRDGEPPVPRLGEADPDLIADRPALGSGHRVQHGDAVGVQVLEPGRCRRQGRRSCRSWRRRRRRGPWSRHRPRPWRCARRTRPRPRVAGRVAWQARGRAPRSCRCRSGSRCRTGPTLQLTRCGSPLRQCRRASAQAVAQRSARSTSWPGTEQGGLRPASRRTRERRPCHPEDQGPLAAWTAGWTRADSLLRHPVTPHPRAWRQAPCT
jgi:hypothetical protein